MTTTGTTQDLHPAVQRSIELCGIKHQVLSCDAEFADTAQFCERYGISPSQTANCILVASKTDPPQVACCVVLATGKLDVNKKVCQLLGVKKASFASADLTMQLTNMQIGGVTPFGVPDMPFYIDAAVMQPPQIILGGGNRSTKLRLEPQELLKLPRTQVIEGLATPRE